MPKLLLSDWPFLPGEPVTLYWIRSPYMFGPDKQWTTDTIFKRKNGNLRSLRLPWGALPLLRLGSEYMDGVDTGRAVLGEETTLTLSEKTSISIEEAAKAVRRSLYPLSTEANLRERVVVLFDGPRTIIVPCIELIRSFFAINKTLSYALLRPDSFTDLCVAYHDDENRVKIVFLKDFPYNSLNHPVASRISLILFDDKWSASWESVWTDRLSESSDTAECVPLRCYPPVLKDCTWNVRAIVRQDAVFVLELSGVTVKTPFPFKSISYRHPSSFYYKRPQSRKDSFCVPGYEEGDPFAIDMSSSAPKNITNPQTSWIGISFYKHSTNPKVKGLKEFRPPKPPEPNAAGERYHPVGEGGSSPAQVGLSDEAGVGVVQALEFLPLNETASYPPSFGDFFQAVLSASKRISSMNMYYKIGTMPAKSALAKIGARERRYALVFMVIGNIRAYIIELELLDKHEISTIVFIAGEIGDAFSEKIKTLLSDCIIGKGSWCLLKIKEKIQIQFYLVRHRSLQSNIWGRRLLGKLWRGFFSNRNQTSSVAL